MALGFAALAARVAAQAPSGHDYPYTAVPFTSVTIDDAFWLPRMQTSRATTIPYAIEQCEKTGRIRNFERAGGQRDGEFEGSYPFDDSDVYKIVEGIAYALHLQPDPALDARADELIAKIAAAQEEDGYLYTARTLKCERLKSWYGDARYEKEQGSHELYNAGHLFEAACAHFEATGRRNFLDVALALANRLASDFGPQGEHKPPGHQGIEIGLCRLYRVTGERRWLDLARFLLEVRGVHEGRASWGEYCQDHVPVLQQKEAVGHAVRAAYMYAGMADVAALTGEKRWIDAIDTLWQDVVGKKLYLTGGIGATGAGEAFGKAYELPNASAYCETCAAIANVFWNHRLFLLHGDGRYIDVLERSLYNNCLSGIGLDGKTFFYPNALASFQGAQRSAWFACACCPSNDARFVPSLGRYAYARQGDDLFVNLFVAGSVRVAMPGGEVGLRVDTRYPWDGRVQITVDTDAPRRVRMRLRVPGWARDQVVPSDLYEFADAIDARPTVSVNGQVQDAEVERGYFGLDRLWQKGDVVTLDLPMPVRRVRAHAEVADCSGRIALQRGPLVYCVEGVDTSSGDVLDMVVGDADLTVEARKDLLGGVVVVRGTGTRVRRTQDGAGREDAGEVTFAAIPYYGWAHRGRTPMAVWLAATPGAAIPGPADTLAHRAKATASHNGRLTGALADQMDVAAPGDKSRPFFHWWPRLGGREWVQYEFDRPATVHGSEVYWLHDLPHGACDYPVSWRVLYRDGEGWKPVEAKGSYGVTPGVYNRVEWAPVTTTALRLEVQLGEKLSAGIHEWRLLEGE
ncbi:MAG: glycoside hydrolase family 127 protein [Planctomycetota bacterium]